MADGTWVNTNKSKFVDPPEISKNNSVGRGGRTYPRSCHESRNAQPLHFGNECRALESESGRGAFETSDDPVGLSQSLNDVFTLGILQCEPGTRALSRNVREWVVLIQFRQRKTQHFARGKNHGAFDEVL